MLDQTSVHVFMGSLETAVSKVKGCVRRHNSESVPLSVITKIYHEDLSIKCYRMWDKSFTKGL